MDFTFTTPEAFDGEYEEFIREMDADEALPAGESEGVFGNIDEDAVCGNGYNDENRYEGDDCPLDGDAESALASCGWGTDEDYGG
jgi:hypothetical protein